MRDNTNALRAFYDHYLLFITCNLKKRHSRAYPDSVEHEAAKAASQLIIRIIKRVRASGRGSGRGECSKTSKGARDNDSWHPDSEQDAQDSARNVHRASAGVKVGPEALQKKHEGGRVQREQ